MEEHIVKVLSINPVTHNVKQYRVTKPTGYTFIPGQATELAINLPRWKEERRPFTFTSLNEWDHLEFTIKSYRDHDGVTNHLDKLNPGDELIIHDVWGAIQYKGEGTFIAGGAGVTPFIAILRQLYKDGKVGKNQLIFSNRTKADIILQEEFRRILGNNFVNTFTDEKTSEYDYGIIDGAYLRSRIPDFSRQFYICGPDPMVTAMQETLKKLGAKDSVITVEM
jgi:ferredoxin-NADP reductase